MSYATPPDVRALVKLLTSIPDGEIMSYLDRASRVIDMELSRCYVVPVAAPPAIIRDIEAELAAAYLLDKNFSDRAPERSQLAEVSERRAMNRLKSLLDTDVSIDGLVLQSSRQFGIRSSTPKASTAQTRWGNLEAFQ